jgi:hypothetical protein
LEEENSAKGADNKRLEEENTRLLEDLKQTKEGADEKSTNSVTKLRRTVSAERDTVTDTVTDSATDTATKSSRDDDQVRKIEDLQRQLTEDM